MTLIKDFIIKRARKSAINTLVKELKDYQVKIAEAETDSWLNVFNTGVYINVKKAGQTALKMAVLVLEKAAKQSNKPSNKQ